MKRFVRFAFIGMLLINALVVATGLYMAFWPMKSIVVDGDDKILNPNKQVRPGEVLVYSFKYCKYTDKQAAISRTLVGETTTSYPALPSTNRVPPGCGTAVSQNLIVPEAVQPGFYTLRLSATYQLNPLRAPTINHQSERFEVLPKATSSSVSPPSSEDVQSINSTTGTVQAAPSAVTIPFGTDPVTQEPTQPATTPAPTVAPMPTPAPSLVSQVVGNVRGFLGL